MGKYNTAVAAQDAAAEALRNPKWILEVLPYLSFDDEHGNVDIKELSDLLVRYVTNDTAENARFVADMLLDAVEEQLVERFKSRVPSVDEPAIERTGEPA